MNPTIFGVIGPGFLNQVPTLITPNALNQTEIGSDMFPLLRSFPFPLFVRMTIELRCVISQCVVKAG